MERIPGGTVTRRTVAAGRKGLRISAVRRYTAAVCSMTGSTRIVRIRCCADQRIIMTARTTRCSHLHQARMIRRYRRMRVLPRIRMTRRTVAACCKGLRVGAVGSHQGTVARVMAIRTICKMRCGIDKRICMTADTVVCTGGCYQ